jgi:hypothetical protein
LLADKAQTTIYIPLAAVGTVNFRCKQIAFIVIYLLSLALRDPRR